MQKNELKGYDKPYFDKRVKSLLEIETIGNLLAKITGMLIVSLILILFLGNLARAQSTDQIFLVPLVSLTPTGAAIYQPQTGDGAVSLGAQKKNTNTGLNGPTLTSPVNLTDNSDIYSKGANYRPPQYDAFATGSASKPIPLPAPGVNRVESVDFRISNNMPGSTDGSVGTVKTTFVFTASAVTQSLNGLNLEYRWDFDNDGNPDSYFSKIQSINHKFSAAGVYQVKLEVLDKGGNVYEGFRKVTVVQNDAPNAYFQVDKVSAPIKSIVKFDTRLSSDNQYSRYNLKYRFDWDGDGKFDTNFQNKNEWFHQFTEVGNFDVIMEVADPEGDKAQASINITILDDSAPLAMMSISHLDKFNYLFDASQSSDDHSLLNSLKFRWDFNYGGNNDILFDTGWSGSPKYTGNYHVGGRKKIRLQVMDEQGFIGESFAVIDVAWTVGYVNLAVGIMQ